MTADLITTLGTAAGSAWLSGINLYATVLTLGMLQRFHLVKLPGGLDMLGEWWVIGLAAALYLIEFVADKIPAVDTAWDAIHTLIRVPAGAILAASAFADFDPAVKMAAMILGGGIALSSHGTKAATRLSLSPCLLVSLSPCPLVFLPSFAEIRRLFLRAGAFIGDAGHHEEQVGQAVEIDQRVFVDS